MQERTAAAAGDQLAISIATLITRIVVQIAGNLDRDGRLAAVYQALQIHHVLVRLTDGLFANPARLDPRRFRTDNDDAIALVQKFRHALEVLDLRDIEIELELHVEAPDPPAMRQLDREIAARLRRGPLADPASLLAEQPDERGQAVVPVVVTR